MAFKHHLVLSTHQMRVHHGQTRGQHPCAHGDLALVALAHMEWRRVDDRQQLGTRLFGQARGLFKPGVLANQQAYFDAGRALPRLEHTNAFARREVAPFIKYLVVGQLALGVGGKHLPFADNAGGIVPTRHRHRFGAQRVRFAAAAGVAHHHGHVF